MAERCSDCDVEGNFQRYKGMLYCPQHYEARLLGELLTLYEAWEEGKEPSKRLRYLMGRSIQEFFDVGKECISKARVEERGFAFKKTGEGYEFEITRHPFAHVAPEKMSREVQRWRVNIAGREAAVFEVRKWKRSDPG